MNRRRSGMAIVELAVALPILVVLAFGTLEACSMIYVKQSLSIAAYEGARVALVPQSTSVDVHEQVEGVLYGRRIQEYSVTVNPDVEMAGMKTFISVTATADCDQTLMLVGWFYQGKSLQSTVQMMKEFD